MKSLEVRRLEFKIFLLDCQIRNLDWQLGVPKNERHKISWWWIK
jgi:hypothetical protein